MDESTRVDEGHKALTVIIAKHKELNLADANEAETRLKVIDELIFNVLGWNKEDVSVEERVSEDGQTKFADYILRTISTAILIEAKRIGTAFSLPSNRTKLKLGGVLQEGEIGTAIKQARDYCRKKSIPFSVATNGGSWVIFPAIRTDQVTFEESEAYIFRDLNDIKNRFVDFWEILSRERVLDGNLENELLKSSCLPGTFRRLRDKLPEPGYRLGRNALYDYIEPAVTEALTDEALLENIEALDACYVKTSERLKYDNRLQMHIHDPKPPLGHPTIRIKGRKQQQKVEAAIDSVRCFGPQRFIVILGPVGAGKTTFLHYTRKISAAKTINGKVLWLLVDFKRATLSDDPRLFIFRELLNLIENDSEFMLGDWEATIKKAYDDKITSLKHGPLFLIAKNSVADFEKKVAEIINFDREQTEPYVENILKYANTKYPCFLIIDNVDQIEDPGLQERIFIEAQAIARRIGFSVIMSLRETTYLKHRDRPVFNAFQFDSFYIDPPSVLPVLSHRFGYAKKVLGQLPITLTTEKGISTQIPDLSQFFDIVARSVLHDEAGLMIECLSGGNIRRGLHLVREFLASGHTNADRAIAAYLIEGEYKFPRHEVFKGAVLGSSKYFNDIYSLMPNMFDSKCGTIGQQLLRLRLVDRLVSTSEHQPSTGVPIVQIVAELDKIGITQDTLIRQIDDLARRGFFITADGLMLNINSTIIPTRLAGFAIRQLCKEFTYAEMCCLDAMILDTDSWSKLINLTNDIESSHAPFDKMILRQKRMQVFFEYISLCEEPWVVECRRHGLSGVWSRQIISEISNAVIRDTNKALESAERIYGSGSSGRANIVLGTISKTWPDKDYVFIQDDANIEWFSHRTDFTSEQDWNNRSVGQSCEFKKIEYNTGKRKAYAISIVKQ